MIAIGPALRRRREELGISQTALAAAVGMRQTDISKIETEQRRQITLTTLRRLTSTLRLRLVLVPEECGAPTDGTADFCPDHDPDAAA
jgi:transcriptional regulator with XRE-family HTH domain